MARRIAATVLLLSAGFSLTAAVAQKERPTPYWASIASGKAMMRTGPGRNYPATWLYVRPDLPIKVVKTYPDWRKVEDSKGATGWMLVRLLSDTRTAIIREGAARALHDAPDAGSPVRYHAAPGVVGRLSACRGAWCRLDVGGRQGYILAADIWGVTPGETFD